METCESKMGNLVINSDRNMSFPNLFTEPFVSLTNEPEQCSSIQIDNIISYNDHSNDLIQPLINWRDYLNYCLLCGHNTQNPTQTKAHQLQKLKAHYIQMHLPYYKTNANQSHYIYCFLCQKNIPHGEYRYIGHFFKHHENVLQDLLSKAFFEGKIFPMICLLCAKKEGLQIIANTILCHHCSAILIQNNNKWQDRPTDRAWLKRNNKGELTSFERLRAVGCNWKKVFPQGNIEYLMTKRTNMPGFWFSKQHITNVLLPPNFEQAISINKVTKPIVLLQRLESSENDEIYLHRFLYRQYRYVWGKIHDLSELSFGYPLACPYCIHAKKFFLRKETYKWHIQEHHLNNVHYLLSKDPLSHFTLHLPPPPNYWDSLLRSRLLNTDYHFINKFIIFR